MPLESESFTYLLGLEIFTSQIVASTKVTHKNTGKSATAVGRSTARWDFGTLLVEQDIYDKEQVTTGNDTITATIDFKAGRFTYRLVGPCLELSRDGQKQALVNELSL